MTELTAERLREVLRYDPETGKFYWREKIACKVVIGKESGCLSSNGYILIRLFGVLYRANRLAWLYMIGEWPTDKMDHADLNRSNNRWANLRPCSTSENARNMHRHMDSQTGLKGVTLEKRTGRYFARICVNRRTFHIGTFDTSQLAAAAYDLTARELHGEFARTNGE